PSGTKNPYSAGVQAQRHHPWRVMRRVARQLPLGVGVDGAEVQFAPEVEDEVGQMVLGEPVPWRRRQQVGLIRVVRAVRLAHTPKSSHLPASVDPRAAYRNRLLGKRGYRVIAHDRRGHGRSEQTWSGNDMDTYADDLARLLDELDLRDVVLVGHSTGGGEVTRYIGRHGTDRVARVVLLGAVPPQLVEGP